jgi:hypothetical protein
MSDRENKPRPNYAPVYAAAMYPGLAAIAQKHGYALAIHGSLARDLDVIAIPWTQEAGEPQAILDEVLRTYALSLMEEIGHKPHGRLAYTLSCGWGECSIDFQFMPRKETVSCGGP